MITYEISSNPIISSMPTKELLTHGGEHHEIVDGEGLVMTTATNPSLRSPNGLQIRAPDEEQEVAAAPYRKT